MYVISPVNLHKDLGLSSLNSTILENVFLSSSNLIL